MLRVYGVSIWSKSSIAWTTVSWAQWWHCSGLVKRAKFYRRISASVKPSTLFLRARGLPRLLGFLSSSLSSESLSDPDERFLSLEPTSLSLSLALAYKQNTHVLNDTSARLLLFLIFINTHWRSRRRRESPGAEGETQTRLPRIHFKHSKTWLSFHWGSRSMI